MKKPSWINTLNLKLKGSKLILLAQKIIKLLQFISYISLASVVIISNNILRILCCILFIGMSSKKRNKLSDVIALPLYKLHSKVLYSYFSKVLGYNNNKIDNLSKDHSYIIISNHQSYLDTFLIWALSPHNSPTDVIFLLKKELIWLPFYGSYSYLSRYPFIESPSLKAMRKKPELKNKDLTTILESVKTFEGRASLWAIYVEGILNKSNDRHLNKPKTSGLYSLIKALDKPVDIIDLTIAYPRIGMSFYELITDISKKGTYFIDTIKFNDIPTEKREFIKWLNRRWNKKESLLKNHYAQADNYKNVVNYFLEPNNPNIDEKAK